MQGQSSQDNLEIDWDAFWITHPEIETNKTGVYHFQKHLVLDESPEHFTIHISADNRYKLYVNGQLVCFGPARGDLLNWRYETIDISPYLKSGQNKIAATVWNLAEKGPLAQITNGTALIVQGNSVTQSAINTDSTWKVVRDNAYEFYDIDFLETYYAVGPGEKFDGKHHPWGWTTSTQSHGISALELEKGTSMKSLGKWGEVPTRPLVPREIPLMELKSQQFPAIRRVTGIEGADNILLEDQSLKIPPHTKVTILLDQEELTTAYPRLQWSRGSQAKLKLTYAESLFQTSHVDGKIRPIHKKGNRNEVSNKVIWGNYDEIISDGGMNCVFEPLWWRTFRYVQLDIETFDEELTLQHISSVFTGYPLTRKARFTSDNTELPDIYDISWRTQRLCAGESYFDCPYYEQLQYVGDTRVQAYNTLYAAGDTLLWRKSIRDFYDSRTPTGLTRARYPARGQQLIPTYSLVWVTMLWDYWMYANDEAFIKPMLPAAMDIVNWFEQRLLPNRLPGKLAGWQFVDWVTAEGWDAGIPPLLDGQQSALIALQYAYTLQLAAELMHHFEHKGAAVHYEKLADNIITAVNNTCWDDQRGMYSDTPEKKYYSQHTNVLAILTNALPTADQLTLFNKISEENNIAPCSYYFKFYEIEALQKLGLGDEYIDRLEPWLQMLEMGLTTTMERPDPSRSDCHAWSASPLFHYYSIICGVRSASPGFDEVRIAPNLGKMRWVEASVPHRLGAIEIKLKRTKEGLTGEVELPVGLVGKFVWKEKEINIAEGQNLINFQ